MMLAPVTHILPLTSVRRERTLNVPARVLVRKGQEVSASDPVATAVLHPEHMMLDIGRGLGLSPKRADEKLQCKAGDRVSEGDLLAGPVGIARRVMRSPRDGLVVEVGNGKILLEVSSHPFELKAGMPGIVFELIPERGAIIQTTGALIQGVWGNGIIDYGQLLVLVNSPDQELTADQFDVSMRGMIVVGGYCGDPSVLKTAAELPLRGLVLSSMASALVHAAERVRIPVMVLEGFGRRDMDSAALKLLLTSDRREAALNSEKWNRYAGTRPELVIPLSAMGSLSPPVETATYSAGQQVRVVSAPYFGKIGQIIEITGVAILPNGLRAISADVQLESGDVVRLPLVNLEVLK